VYSREATPETTIMLGIHKDRLYKLMGRLIVWSNGYLDSTLYFSSNSMLDSTSTSKVLSKVGRCETPPSTMGRMSP
jgi:hypothetical protein